MNKKFSRRTLAISWLTAACAVAEAAFLPCQAGIVGAVASVFLAAFVTLPAAPPSPGQEMREAARKAGLLP